MLHSAAEPRPTDDELYVEYWFLRTPAGGSHGIIGGMQVLVEKYGIAWSEIQSITHRVKDDH